MTHIYRTCHANTCRSLKECSKAILTFKYQEQNYRSNNFLSSKGFIEGIFMYEAVTLISSCTTNFGKQKGIAHTDQVEAAKV